MKKIVNLGLIFSLVAFAIYGSFRFYFLLTDGFRIVNITSDFLYDCRWETRPVSNDQMQKVLQVMDQSFFYLGKGCQSYVFSSEDDRYVLKFFKYQRYRKSFIDYFDFIPWVNHYRKGRLEHKNKKLNRLFESWKIAFDYLSDETEVLYVHLNKTDYLHKCLKIRDKLGIYHFVDLDQMEFMIQRKATMLCVAIEQFMKRGAVGEAKALLHRIFKMILSEYNRGLADNDHALMQNTGIVDGKPIHVDVGQFVCDNQMKDFKFYAQHLVNKMYKFNLWLKDQYPELELELKNEMSAVLGDEVNSFQYQKNQFCDD